MGNPVGTGLNKVFVTTKVEKKSEKEIVEIYFGGFFNVTENNI
jgi:hypothetical protein